MANEPDFNAAVYGESVQCREVVFTEAGAAGVYTGSVYQPGGTTLLDVIVNGVALWGAGTSATMIVGDETDDDGYYTGINAKATDLLAGESLSFAFAGGKGGSYIANSQISPRYTATGRNIIGKITAAGTSATTGRTRMIVVYAKPTNKYSTDASYVAS